MKSALESYWDEMDRPANQPPGKPRAATMGEVGRGLMELPKVVGQMLIMPGFWLCGLMMTVAMALYVLVPGLLFSYLPMRLFGVMEGTPGFDALLGILLATIAGLVIWGKVNRSREKKRLADKVDALRQRNGELQTNLARVIEQKGRNHPETAYTYRELGENWKQLGDYQEAVKAHRAELEISRETLGAKSPEVARASRSLAGLIFAYDRSQEKSSLLWEAEKIEKAYR